MAATHLACRLQAACLVLESARELRSLTFAAFLLAAFPYADDVYNAIASRLGAPRKRRLKTLAIAGDAKKSASS